MKASISCSATSSVGKCWRNPWLSAIPAKASYMMRAHGLASEATAGRIVTAIVPSRCGAHVWTETPPSRRRSSRQEKQGGAFAQAENAERTRRGYETEAGLQAT